MKAVWKVEGWKLALPGAGYKRRADAVEAARLADGCGLNAGMRARRYMVSPEQWARAL